MAKRLTITIPDELATDLEPHKEGIVVSNVCASALRTAVAERVALQELSGLERAALRMRAQRKQAEDQPRKDAYSAGWSWIAASADYEDVLDWLHIRDSNYEPADRGEEAMINEDRFNLVANNVFNMLHEGGGVSAHSSVIQTLFAHLEAAKCLPPPRDDDEQEDDWEAVHRDLWPKFSTLHEAFLEGVADAWKRIQPTVEND